MRSSSCCMGDVTMEVPLAWQDPVHLPCFPVTEGGADDVPPSPTRDSIAPTLAAGNFFQQGFLDCAQEALRFLTEEEGMSETNPVVVGLRRRLVHATPHLTPAGSSPCASSSSLHRGRFAPYTVPSHRSLGPGHPRREGDKCGVSVAPSERGSLHYRWSASTAPSVPKMEQVFSSDLISTDDLQGVLRCLGSEQSQKSQAPDEHSSVLCSPSVLPSSFPSLPMSAEVCVAEGKRRRWQQGSLDDSGISEGSSADLADEVDGADSKHTSLSDSDCNLDLPAGVDSVFVSVLDSACDAQVLDGDTKVTVAGESSEGCTTADRLAHKTIPSDTEMSRLNSSQNSPPGSTTVSASLSHLSSPTATPARDAASSHHSSPSSQLALLSSLSSGTHHLTSLSADSGDATASRIQSLASQILLLLQEEADAQDCSDDDDDDDDDTDSHTSELGESDDSDVEDGLFDLEAEP